MNNVYKRSEIGDACQVRHIGVTLTLLTPGQYHCGVYFEEEGDYVHLHLKSNLDLRVESHLTNAYLFLDPVYSDRRLQFVAEMACMIRDENFESGIPYGFSNPSGAFTQEGKFDLGPSDSGLTCASFVLSTFNAAGLELLNFASIPSSRENTDWQRLVHANYSARYSPKNPWLKMLYEDIGKARVRPEESAAASIESNLPSQYEDIQPLATELRSCFTE